VPPALKTVMNWRSVTGARAPVLPLCACARRRPAHRAERRSATAPGGRQREPRAQGRPEARALLIASGSLVHQCRPRLVQPDLGLGGSLLERQPREPRPTTHRPTSSLPRHPCLAKAIPPPRSASHSKGHEPHEGIRQLMQCHCRTLLKPPTPNGLQRERRLDHQAELSDRSGSRSPRKRPQQACRRLNRRRCWPARPRGMTSVFA
jgi:hypothetical protein